MQLLDLRFDIRRLDPKPLGHLVLTCFVLWQKLMQWRVKQPNRNRQSSHRLKYTLEIASLVRQQFLQRTFELLLGNSIFLLNCLFLFSGLGCTNLLKHQSIIIGCQNHLAYRPNSLALEEHMLGPAKPYTFSAKVSRPLCIARRIGIRANSKFANLVANLHKLAEVAAHRRLNRPQLSGHNLTRRAVQTNPISFFKRQLTNSKFLRLIIYMQRTDTRHAAFAHTACNNRRMACHTAASRQNADCCVHTTDIFRAGLNPNKDDLLALAVPRLRGISGEHNLSHRGPRRRRKPFCDYIATGFRIKVRMQQAV